MIKKTMTSPFTGGVAALLSEPSTLVFRKETFHFVHQFYECQDSHERFSTSELDEAKWTFGHKDVGDIGFWREPIQTV